MAISSAQAIYGLKCTGAASSTNVSGSLTVGKSQATEPFATANIGYSVQGELTTSGNTLVLDLQSGAGSGTAHVAGTAQVETATVVAASGCTSNGNCSLTLTSAAVTGSPLSVVVALTTASNTATLVAAALAAGIAANTAAAAVWTATSSGADIILTRKTDANGYHYANETGTNLAIPGGIGITAAGTSADTTAGVVTSGSLITDGDGKDFQGVTLVSGLTLYGVLVEVISGSATASNGTHVFPLPAQFWNASGFTGTFLTADLTITSTAAKTVVRVTVLSKSS